MTTFRSAFAFVLSALFRLGLAGKPWRPLGGADADAQTTFGASSSTMLHGSAAPVVLAAAAMPSPLSMPPAPTITAETILQQPPEDSSGWEDYVGRFASAACIATVSAVAVANRGRRRGRAARLALRNGAAAISNSTNTRAVFPAEVAEMRQAVETRQMVRNMSFGTYQPELQFVNVGWAPVLVRIDQQDEASYNCGALHAWPGYEYIPAQEIQSPTALERGLSSSSTDVDYGHSNQVLSVSKTESAKILAALSEDSSAEKRTLLSWVIESAWPLANSYEGSRIVQKAFEVSDTTDEATLKDTLQGRVIEALKSPHANYVLQKCIEVTPASQLGFITSELKGNAVLAAKHRFGCRILERLFEHHCSELPTGALMDEIVAETSTLCRHSYANFVVQHVLEHGSVSHRAQITEVLLRDVCRLAKHRVASHVVQSALVYASPQDRARLKEAILCDTTELEDIRKTQCGRFVVEELVRA